MSAATTLAERTRSLLKEKGMSYQEAANHLGISKSAFTHYMAAYRQMPLDILLKVAAMFQVPVDWLLGRTDDRHDYAVEPPDYAAALLRLEEAGFTLDEIVLVAREMNDLLGKLRVMKKAEPGSM